MSTVTGSPASASPLPASELEAMDAYSRTVVGIAERV
jgi:hypothetical protein